MRIINYQAKLNERSEREKFGRGEQFCGKTYRSAGLVIVRSAEFLDYLQTGNVGELWNKIILVQVEISLEFVYRTFVNHVDNLDRKRRAGNFNFF